MQLDRVIRFGLGSLVALGVLPTVAAGSDFTIVRRGVPTAAIVISATAMREERLAATELQTYVRKISGVTLPIATVPQKPGIVPSIRIGTFGADPVKEWDGEKPPSDGFALETRGRTLWIVGGDPRGTLYGVYELLEGTLGVRWFMPGDLGEDVPTRTTLELPPLRKKQGPAFRYVSGFIWAGGPGAREWELRMRADVGAPVSFGHNWSRILPMTAANLAANPEWFALFQGVRGSSNQLCSAHPDVVRVTAEAARRFFDASPNIPLFSISPNDGYGFCEDWRCKAVDAFYGVTDRTLSDRFVHYGNQVLEELESTHPGRQVGILAYVDHTNPPYRARPRPEYAALVCHTPWEFCHVHAIDDPACPRNRRFASYLRGWTQLTRHAGVYDYYGHFYMFTPWPIVHTIRRDLPLFHDLGIERLTSETQQNWANQGLNFYVAAKLARNPKTDVDQLLEEYYSRFYGKAAQPMRRYWERWEQAMIATAEEGDGGYEWMRMFTPQLVAECGQYLGEAERLAAGDREKVARRVAFARAGFRFTEAWTRMLDSGLKGDIPTAMAAGEEAIRRVRETSGSVPQAFFIALAIGQTEHLMRLIASGQIPWVALRP